MTKSYCLTIEVTSDHIENGLGYMIAFSIPKHMDRPVDMAEFECWRDEVREIVLRAGDECLHHDHYTKKLAIATMMHDLAELNERYDIQIGFLPGVPAVQIQSTNPFDNMIEIDFTDRQGRFRVAEKGLADLNRSSVTENGKTGLTEASRRHFPFKKLTRQQQPCLQRPPRP